MADQTQDVPLPQMPGSSGNESIGALSQMMEQRRKLNEDLQGQYKTAQGQRDTARSGMDEAYQQAMEVLKKPVQDNTWLQVALTAGKPTMPWENGLLNAAQAAQNEQMRVYEQTQKNALAAGQMGINWQGAKMKEAQDLSDKLLGSITKVAGGGAGMVGKIVTRPLDDGSILILNNLTGEKQVIPATHAKAWEAAHRQGYTAAVANEHPDPEAFAAEYANTVAAKVPSAQGRPMQAGQTGALPGVGQAQPQVPPLLPAGGQTQPTAQSAPVGIVAGNLPPDVQQELDRQIARLQANPNDATLRENTLKRLRELAAQYPAAQGRPGTVDASGNAPIMQGDVTAPAQAVAKPGTPSFQYLDKVQRSQDIHAAGGAGKNLADYEKLLTEKSDAAIGMDRNLNHMLEAAQSANFGAGSNFKTQALKWSDTLGVPLTEEEKAAMNGNQIIGKIGLQLATLGSKAITSRPTQMEFQKLLEEGVPSTGMTKDAFLRVLSLFKETAGKDKDQLSEFMSWKHSVPEKGLSGGDFSNYWQLKASDPKFATITPRDISDTMKARGWTYQQTLDKLRGVK